MSLNKANIRECRLSVGSSVERERMQPEDEGCSREELVQQKAAEAGGEDDLGERNSKIFDQRYVYVRLRAYFLDAQQPQSQPIHPHRPETIARNSQGPFREDVPVFPSPSIRRIVE